MKAQIFGIPKKLFFVGIGGAGMAPLALLAKNAGCQVAGSDCASTPKTAFLQKKGITVNIGHSATNIASDTELLIFSSAVPADNPEREKAFKLGIPQLRRGEFLARIAADYKLVATISGSHGKSSITALLVHILISAGAAPGYLIGAEPNNGDAFSSGNGKNIFITEVDESDGTHTAIISDIGIVPNIEEDHAWSIGGAEQLMHNFATFGQNSRRLIYCAGENTDKLFTNHPNAMRLSKLPETYLGFYGFQAKNAALAVIAAEEFGISREVAESAARSFPGINRRMKLRHSSDNLIIVEDYAHHPSEIAAAITLLRNKYPGVHIRVLLQPHRYARLEYFFEGFKKELAKADSVLILPVFAAWCESGKVDAATLCSALDKAKYLNGTWQEVAHDALIPPAGDKPLLLAVLGAGDINEVFNYLPGNLS